MLLLGSGATGSTNAHTLRFLEKPATFKFLDTPPLQGAEGTIRESAAAGGNQHLVVRLP